MDLVVTLFYYLFSLVPKFITCRIKRWTSNFLLEISGFFSIIMATDSSIRLPFTVSRYTSMAKEYEYLSLFQFIDSSWGMLVKRWSFHTRLIFFLLVLSYNNFIASNYFSSVKFLRY